MNIRQQQLLNKLNRLGFLSIEEESVANQVSTMTIRRDILRFERLGLALRTPGGAIPRQSDRNILLAGEGPSSPAQKIIARQAVAILSGLQTIMLSTGRTTLEVARHLALTDSKLAVITNSLSIATVLFQTSVQVILTGGSLRNESLDLVGPVTEKNLDEYYIDLLIAGCDGAMAGEGFFTRDLNLAAMERKSVEKSHRVIIVTESHKFGRPSFVKFAGLDSVDMLITDSGLSDRDHDLLRQAGIEVVIC